MFEVHVYEFRFDLFPIFIFCRTVRGDHCIHRQNFIVASVISEKEPARVARSGNSLILIVPGGKYLIHCNDLMDALKAAFMCFYALHYKYATPQKCLHGILDRFSEMKAT